MIKIDVYGLTADELPGAVMQYSAYGVKLVAKKVETREQLRACQRLGFDLFQGYVLSRPEIIEGQVLSPNKLACLRILERLCDPETSAEEIEDVVKTDAALSYRFLRIAGAGAARGFSRRLSSVREGVVLVGQRRLRAWVTLMLLADNRGHEGADEQLAIAMTRAKMAELMAMELAPSLAEQAFTVGLVSALDLLLSTPIAEIMKDLSLTAEVEEALLDRAGLLGGVLEDVLAWEVGGAQVVRSGLEMASISEAYEQALSWATDLCGALDTSGSSG